MLSQALYSEALPASDYIQPQDTSKEAHVTAQVTVQRTKDTVLHDLPRSTWVQAGLSPGIYTSAQALSPHGSRRV